MTAPPELQQDATEPPYPDYTPAPEVRPPPTAAPAVCVIDSGIQEAHRWLEPAIDCPTSRCFLPGADPADVADYVAPRGHGTGVAGAVLYPDAIPASGTVHPVAWIQNARVLDGKLLLYRVLIAQSARWPGWAEAETNKDWVLRWIGYGLPSLERASRNSKTRVTLITPDAQTLPSKQLHLYTVRIPEELRSAAREASIRIDVTLAYTALPRRSRARRTGYLETWLDWEASAG